MLRLCATGQPHSLSPDAMASLLHSVIRFYFKGIILVSIPRWSCCPLKHTHTPLFFPLFHPQKKKQSISYIFTCNKHAFSVLHVRAQYTKILFRRSLTLSSISCLTPSNQVLTPTIPLLLFLSESPVTSLFLNLVIYLFI